MADQKVSQLTQLTTILPLDVIPIVDNGSLYKANSNAIVVQNIITGILVTGASFLTKIVGGTSNTATGNQAGVLGGQNVNANATRSTILNGVNSIVYDNANYGCVLAGNTNYIGDTNGTPYGLVGNGQANRVNGTQATILNGQGGNATGVASFIGNGINNTVFGDYSTILNGNGNFIANPGIYNSIFGSVGQTITGSYDCIVNGYNNTISNSIGSIIGAGFNNYIRGGLYNFIGAGDNNVLTETSTESIILGGTKSIIGSANSFVGCGARNAISGDNSAILGGTDSSILSNSSFSIICGGSFNQTQNIYGQILGGNSNTLSGAYQTAIGNFINMDASHTGATMLSDNNQTKKYSFSEKSLTLSFESGIIITGGGNLIIPTNNKIPKSSLSLGYTPGTILISGGNLIICTGVINNSGMFGRLIISSY